MGAKGPLGLNKSKSVSPFVPPSRALPGTRALCVLGLAAHPFCLRIACWNEQQLRLHTRPSHVLFQRCAPQPPTSPLQLALRRMDGD